MLAGGPPGAGIKSQLPFGRQARGSAPTELPPSLKLPMGLWDLPIPPGPPLPGMLCRERQQHLDPPVGIPGASSRAGGGCGREPPAWARLSHPGSGRDARKQANQIIHS